MFNRKWWIQTHTLTIRCLLFAFYSHWQLLLVNKYHFTVRLDGITNSSKCWFFPCKMQNQINFCNTFSVRLWKWELQNAAINIKTSFFVQTLCLCNGCSSTIIESVSEKFLRDLNSIVNKKKRRMMRVGVGVWVFGCTEISEENQANHKLTSQFPI